MLVTFCRRFWVRKLAEFLQHPALTFDFLAVLALM